MDNSDNAQSNHIKYLEMIDAWRNEKLSQDLLPHKEELITYLITKIEKKEQEITDLKMDKDTKYFIEIDIQRIKFLIKDYLRIRLMKIEKYLFYLMKNDKLDILTKEEIGVAAELMDMKAVYFNQSLKKMNSLVNNFYQFVTNNKEKRVENAKNILDSMIVKPPENDFVIVQNISNDNIVLNIKEIYNDYQSEFITLEPDDKCLVPFKLIERELNDNKVKII